MTMKERIEKINKTAREDFAKAQGMLEMFNDIYGTQYGWLAKRVVIFDDPSLGHMSPCHDAWANL